MKIYKYILEIAVFVCGAVVMIFELIGSRILWPYFGTSIFIWTSLIGIILGSLSIGYYLGGKIADKKPSFKNLSSIILFAAIFIWIIILIKHPLISALQKNFTDIRIWSIIAAIILFSPASILLGMVSPYAVKLKIDSLKTSWSTVGNLYAISTAGSIIWTFLSGFYLIPHFGTNKLIIILSITLVLISFSLYAKNLIKIRISIIVIMITSRWMLNIINDFNQKNWFIDLDTTYNHISIYNSINTKTKDIIRNFSINNDHSSAMFLNKDDLVHEYTKYYHLAKFFNPNFKTTLMLGGAWYSYPKDFLLKYPQATIDVVEIDPMVTQIAKQYFNLKENPNLSIYHQDARVYLNNTQKKYDVIFGDAFSSIYSIPYQLTTKEAIEKEFNILNDNGIVIQNIISSIQWKKSQFLIAEYATYKEIFPQVYIFPVADLKNVDNVQNIILVALKSKDKQTFDYTWSEFKEHLQHLWKEKINIDKPILTDNYAPVDYYINNAIF